MIKSYCLKIYGDVQGVTFRWSAKRKADKFGVCGYIQNQKDGSVYIEAEAQETDLAKFIEWCRKGPLFAQVNRVEVVESEIKGYNVFEIKY